MFAMIALDAIIVLGCLLWAWRALERDLKQGELENRRRNAGGLYDSPNGEEPILERDRR